MYIHALNGVRNRDFSVREISDGACMHYETATAIGELQPRP
jgi:hypothetical protein